MRAALVPLLLLLAGFDSGERVVTLIATAEAKGTPEPCGCTSDPLGDIARVVTLAKARGGLLVDAGGLLYDPERATGERRAQADEKAVALASIYQGRGDVGLGAADLLHGVKAVRPPRQVANCPAVPRAPPRVREIEGVKVGVFGVVAPEAVQPAHLRTGPARAAARAAVESLRRQGAQVIVGLLGMTRAAARQLMTEVDGISFGVVGADVGEGMPEPEAVGSGFLAAPADQLRRVVRIELHVKGGQVALALFAGEAARQLQLERLARKLASLDESLAAWKKDPAADPAFVAARERERAELGAERQRLTSTRPTPPESSYFTYALEPVRRTIARDPDVVEALRKMARAIGEANLRAAASTSPPPPEAGRPHYVGLSACEKCHKPAALLWQRTIHAQAWKTLTTVDKQYDYDCIGCHVTGFLEPGGSALGTVEKQRLIDVQCEVCHGPGSTHVAEAGLDEPRTIIRRPADRFCADRCHTPDHSDTFQLVPYLRDVLGNGHGAQRRRELGDGPTGHELRSKALAAAGK